MKKLFSYFSPYKKECVLAPLLKLSEALLELFIPLLVAQIIDDGVKLGNSQVVIKSVIIMVLLGVLGLALSISGQYFSAKAAVGYSSSLRGALYGKLLRLPLKETDKLGVPRMITALSSDINRIQGGVNLALRLLLRSPFVVLGAFIAALIINWKISLIFLCSIIILSLIVVIIMKITMPSFLKTQRKLDEVSLIARENLTGARVIRAFNGQEIEKEKYQKANEILEKYQNFSNKISALLNPLTFVVVNLAIIALLYFGGIKVEYGILTQGAIIALYDYLSQILVELIKFANLVVTISKALASGKRISQIFEIEEEEIRVSKDEPSPTYLEFKNVCASYGGGEVLSNINIKITKGQTVGIIGGTGSGKSTLVNLLPRLYRPTNGSIYLDGKDLNSYGEEEIAQKVSIAMQKPVLFKGSIKSNILYGKPTATDEEIIEAISIAQASDVVASKEDGINSLVEQGGRNFSGGQKQRLALARAIVGKPEILILDDSSSALDYVTDLNLRRALKNQTLSQTLIIVSQRTASVKDADTIIVLDDGEIVGVGTHQSLYESCEVYREIEDSQGRGD